MNFHVLTLMFSVFLSKPCTVRMATLLSTSIGDPSASQCILVLLYSDDTVTISFLLNTILPSSSAKATGSC